MKQFLLSFLFSCLMFGSAFSQLPDGTIAPNFTVTDINGTSHNLYSYLNANKHVILDFSATWCGPCWAYHNTGALEDIYNEFGPSGTNQVMVIFLESEFGNTGDCLTGNGGTCTGVYPNSSQGNWLAGTPYPVVDLGPTNGPSVRSDYAIGYFPTIYAINYHDKKIYETAQQSAAILETWLFQSFEMSYTGAVINTTPCPLSASVQLTVTNGRPPISYAWSNGENTATISNLANGTYKCTISDANGYEFKTPNYTITGPSPITINTQNQTNVQCGGQETGSIQVNATGGNNGFNYSWSNGYVGSLVTALAAGSYTVTASDSQGCTLTKSYTITQPAPMLANATTTNPGCNLNNGVISIQVTAGTPPYLYELNGNSQSSPIFNNLPGGAYNYAVRDNNQCLVTNSATLTAPVSPVATTAALGSITCLAPTTQVTGAGSSTGSNFSYLWTTTNGNITAGANQLVATVGSAGNYNLLVTNTSNGCTKNSSVAVAANNVVPVVAVQTPSQLNCVTSQVVIDGSQSSNGNNFTYNWTTTNGNIVSGANTLTPTVNQAGNYSLAVTNTTNGCVTNGASTVVQNITLPSLSVPASTVLTCTAPSAELCATTDAASVVWSLGNTSTCITVNQSGSYVVTATGSNGCVSSATANVTLSNGFPQMSIANPNQLTCTVPQVDIAGSVVGNPSDFSYSWTTTDGTIVAGQNALVVTVSDAGTYTLVVTNMASGCTTSQNKTVSEISQAPSAAYTGTLTGNTLTASAGTVSSSSTYLWNFGNGSTSSEPNASTTFTTSGVYNVCLTVTNDCGANTECTSYTISGALSTTATAGNTSCFGAADGTASVTTTGGIAPFSAVWTGPNGFTSTGLSLTGLAVGQYTVVVTDGAGNTSTQIVTVAQPTELAVSSSVIINDANSQNLGGVNIVSTGGNGNYTYLWSNGQTTQNLVGVGAGSYTCVITDAKGCNKTFGPYVVQNLSGLTESKYLNTFSINPNPVSTLLNINIDFVNNGTSEISVINGLGANLLTKKYTGNVTDRLDVSSLASGIYFLNVKGNNFSFARRFVVVK